MLRSPPFLLRVAPGPSPALRARSPQRGEGNQGRGLRFFLFPSPRWGEGSGPGLARERNRRERCAAQSATFQHPRAGPPIDKVGAAAVASTPRVALTRGRSSAEPPARLGCSMLKYGRSLGLSAPPAHPSSKSFRLSMGYLP